MAIKLTTGKQNRAQKVVIYGSEGIGKSTLASQFPAPVFMDVEGGTSQLDVARIDNLPNWMTIVNTVREFAGTEDIGKTLVIDTADWAEKMCIDYICRKYKKNGIEEFGYGKGYTYLQEEFATLLDAANECIAKGKNVVFLAHAKMRKFEQPDEMGAYDRWEMKLSKQVAPILKEWADMVLFLNYQTTIINTNDNKKKATGGKRVIYTSHHPCWDAKNRHGLPDVLPLAWDEPLSNVFVETAGAELSRAATVLGGDIVDKFGNNVNKLTPAQTVRQLGKNNKIDESAILEVLISGGDCSEDVKSLEELDEELLENIIGDWEGFKEAVLEITPF